MLSRSIYVVTGTDTGVGKTVLTALLARRLMEGGSSVAALKPLCSGSRDDAVTLQRALRGSLSLDVINPWYFRAPLAPFLAARREGRSLRRAEVLRHVRLIAQRHSVTLVEGAGGLLSPLGPDFDSRDLITLLRATPVLVGSNRLGAINQVLLAWSALPRTFARRMQIVLVAPKQPELARRSNLEYLRERVGAEQVHELPWIDEAVRDQPAGLPAKIVRVLDAILR